MEQPVDIIVLAPQYQLWLWGLKLVSWPEFCRPLYLQSNPKLCWVGEAICFRTRSKPLRNWFLAVYQRAGETVSRQGGRAESRTALEGGKLSQGHNEKQHGVPHWSQQTHFPGFFTALGCFSLKSVMGIDEVELTSWFQVTLIGISCPWTIPPPPPVLGSEMWTN